MEIHLEEHGSDTNMAHYFLEPVWGNNASTRVEAYRAGAQPLLPDGASAVNGLSQLSAFVVNPFCMVLLKADTSFRGKRQSISIKEASLIVGETFRCSPPSSTH